MKNKGVISLLGCGWLGFPLGIDLISRGFHVKGTTTRLDKLPLLKAERIDPYLVQFDALNPDPDLHEFLDADILIILIPPGRRNVSGFKDYRKMVDVLKLQLPNSRVSKLIFISSTSVYADSNSIITESSVVSPQTDSGRLLDEVEILFRSLPLNVIILRLAGLIGPKRLPGKFYMGKMNIPNGHAPVNLIHLDDVINIINCLIDTHQAEGVYNGCAPSHPSKEEFYTLAAKMEQLEAPQFIPENIKWKLITSERILNELSYSFKVPSLMDWLRQNKNTS